MSNLTPSYSSQASSPATAAFAVTPNDSTALTYVARALYVGGAGNLAVKDLNSGASTTFTAVPAGFILSIRATHVLATGTTATNIVGLA